MSGALSSAEGTDTIRILRTKRVGSIDTLRARGLRNGDTLGMGEVPIPSTPRMEGAARRYLPETERRNCAPTVPLHREAELPTVGTTDAFLSARHTVFAPEGEKVRSPGKGSGIAQFGAASSPASGSANLLALAVLQQAVNDAFSATLKRHRSGGAAAVTQAERDEARRFLQAADGSWAMARRVWCDMAGVEPAWLERQVLAQKLM